MYINTEEEVWKDVPGYEGYYQASDLGRIRGVTRFVPAGNTKRKIKGKVISQFENNQGYYRVGLNKNGKTQHKYVHRLVGETFLPNPNRYPTINHKDENPKNNRADNLEWCTQEYNNLYTKEVYGKKPVVGQNIETGKIIKFESIQAAARAGYYNISSVLKGNRNHSKGYAWTYDK